MVISLAVREFSGELCVALIRVSGKQVKHYQRESVVCIDWIRPGHSEEHERPSQRWPPAFYRTRSPSYVCDLTLFLYLFSLDSFLSSVSIRSRFTLRDVLCCIRFNWFVARLYWTWFRLLMVFIGFHWILLGYILLYVIGVIRLNVSLLVPNGFFNIKIGFISLLFHWISFSFMLFLKKGFTRIYKVFLGLTCLFTGSKWIFQYQTWFYFSFIEFFSDFYQVQQSFACFFECLLGFTSLQLAIKGKIWLDLILLSSSCCFLLVPFTWFLFIC